MKKKTNIVICSILTLVLLFSNVNVLADTFTDIEGNWAYKLIEKWQNSDIIKGFGDGTFRPNDLITRAQFVSMINKAMNYTDKADIIFDDVNESQWYYNDVCIAKEAGYINGISETLFAPEKPVSRQEAIVIIARITKLQANNDVSMFTDRSQISDWAVGEIGAVAEVEYIKGYEDNTIKPLKQLKRAEALQLLDNVINSKNIIVNEDDQRISNKVVEGNIIVTKSIGEGNVYIENTEVKGSIIINGGGNHSVNITNTKADKIVSNKENVHIVLNGTSEVKSIIANQTTSLYIDKDVTVNEIVLDAKCEVDNSGTVKKVVVNASGVTLSGDFDDVSVNPGVEEQPVIDDGSTGGGSAGGGSTGGEPGGDDPIITKKIMKFTFKQADIEKIINVEYKEKDTFINIYNKLKLDSTVKSKIEDIIVKFANIKVNNYQFYSQEMYDKVASMLNIEVNDSLYTSCKPADFSNITISDLDKIVSCQEEIKQHIKNNKDAIIENVKNLNLKNIEITRANSNLSAEDVMYTVKIGDRVFDNTELEDLVLYIVNNIDMLTGPINNINANSVEFIITNPRNASIKIEK